MSLEHSYRKIVEQSESLPVYQFMRKPSFGIASFIVAVLITSSLGADGVFNRPALNSLKTTLEGQNLVVRVPLVETTPPEALGAFIFDSPRGSKEPVTLYIALAKPPPQDWKPVLILGETTVLEPVLEHVVGGYEPSLSFGVRDPAKAMELLLTASKVFGLPLERVRDVRLPTGQPKPKDEIGGPFGLKDIEDIREVVYRHARLQVIHDFVQRIDRKSRDEALLKWPGRHPLQGAGDGKQAGVYYAPNAGFQLEKQEGKWTVVGG